MPTDHEMTLKADCVLQALDDLRWYVKRHGELFAECEQHKQYIAQLESLEADHEADGELLDLLVAWWKGLYVPDNRTAIIVRIRQLIDERESADGPARESRGV